MTFYYTTKPDICFFNDDFNTSIPENAIKISDSDHATLIKGQAEGKEITANLDNFLYLKDRVVSNYPNTKLTALDFMDLFTAAESEKIAIMAQKNTKVFLWYTRTIGSAIVDLSSDNTVSGLQTLVNLNVIDQSRMNDILNGKAAT